MRARENWLKSFENKTESELEELTPPTALPSVFVNLWGRDRDEALARLRTPVAEPEEQEEEGAEEAMSSFSQQRDALEADLSALENDTSRAKVPETFVPSQPPLEIPKGNVADLLEHQIGTCAALIANIADYVARNDSHPNTCFPFMDRISSLLSSSATAARVVGQLRGIATETKQTIITEKGGKGAGGVPQT